MLDLAQIVGWVEETKPNEVKGFMSGFMASTQPTSSYILSGVALWFRECRRSLKCSDRQQIPSIGDRTLLSMLTADPDWLSIWPY